MNLFNVFNKKYASHKEAIIISSYFNPMQSPYRLKAFNQFYDTIKHLNHYIVECVIGDTKPDLPVNENIHRIHTENLLWHKESILNSIIPKLDKKFKYIFWIDADVLFTNKNWLVEGVEQLQTNNIIQPFEYCVHLNQDETKPNFNLDNFRGNVSSPLFRQPQMWRSFCANKANNSCWQHQNYDRHGHVGFAWGARRSILEAVPFYDRALIGGADHIIAHAAVGQIPNSCIEKAFKDDIETVNEWSRKFFEVAQSKVGYVKGDLYHIWHGDIDKRQYLKRIQDFTIKTREIQEKDINGLYITKKKDYPYVRDYFQNREVKEGQKQAYKPSYL